VAVEGRADIVDDPEARLRVGISIWERYHGPYRDEKRKHVDRMMNNRIAVRISPARVRSWDHRKLGLPDMAVAGSTAPAS